MHIRVIPKSKRAKNRVKEHGDIFKVSILDSKFKGNPAHLLDRKWLGWISTKEADFDIVTKGNTRKEIQ